MQQRLINPDADQLNEDEAWTICRVQKAPYASGMIRLLLHQAVELGLTMSTVILSIGQSTEAKTQRIYDVFATCSKHYIGFLQHLFYQCLVKTLVFTRI